MNLLIGMQARSASKRLPNKIYEKIGPAPLLKWVWLACRTGQDLLQKKGFSCETVILGPPKDDALKDFCTENKMKSLFIQNIKEDDLISRYLQSAKALEVDAVIRITADCWRMSGELISEVGQVLGQKQDYVSNTIHRSYPEGYDVQGVSVKGLQWFDQNQKEERQHPFQPFDHNLSIRKEFRRQGLEIGVVYNKRNPIWEKTSIDTKEELEHARSYYEKIAKDRQRMEKPKPESPGSGVSRNQFKEMDTLS